VHNRPFLRHASCCPNPLKSNVAQLGSAGRRNMNVTHNGRQLANTRIAIQIVQQLERGRGLRARPFAFVSPGATIADLHNVAVAEVHRVIRGFPPIAGNEGEGAPSWPSVADGVKVPQQPAHARSVIRELRHYVWLPAVRSAIGALELEIAERQVPPWDDWRKCQCVREAFYLVDTLCKDPPTGSRTGPFIKVAHLLYEAATGDADADLYRICSDVLKGQRAVGLGTADA
jgi:hypothetical protein